MRADVHRDCDPRVSEPFADDLRMHRHLQEEGCVGVPRVVVSDRRRGVVSQFSPCGCQRLREPLREPLGMAMTALEITENEGVVPG
jgi:hypothetical protein